MILAHLDRKALGVLSFGRYGSLLTNPDRVLHGHMICLINRQGGSDCENLGGLVGIRGDKPFRDGGLTTQPEFGFWDLKGKTWLVEGHGVDPDVELDLPPDGFLSGKDAQLDYAIADLTAKIDKEPRALAPKPPILPRPLVLSK